MDITCEVNAAPKLAPQYPNEQKAVKQSQVCISLFEIKKDKPWKNSPENNANMKEIIVEPRKK